jgi:hypothetical protein
MHGWSPSSQRSPGSWQAQVVVLRRNSASVTSNGRNDVRGQDVVAQCPHGTCRSQDGDGGQIPWRACGDGVDTNRVSHGRASQQRSGRGQGDRSRQVLVRWGKWVGGPCGWD